MILYFGIEKIVISSYQKQFFITLHVNKILLHFRSVQAKLHIFNKILRAYSTNSDQYIN